MGKLILVTGGVRSGKSTFAEEKAKSFGDDVIYVATATPFVEEMKERVKKHRLQRPASWETIEAHRDIDSLLEGKIKGKSAVLLDCITVMINNIMFDICPDFNNIGKAEETVILKSVKSSIEKLIEFANVCEIPFVFVTNEIGMGLVPEYRASRIFRDLAGSMNQLIAKACEEVYLCVCGIPVKIK